MKKQGFIVIFHYDQKFNYRNIKLTIYANFWKEKSFNASVYLITSETAGNIFGMSLLNFITGLWQIPHKIRGETFEQFLVGSLSEE